MRAAFARFAAALLEPAAGWPAAGAPQPAFPNVLLRTQNGAALRFYDDLVKGRVVTINFFFTTCTTICPRTTANLAKVQDALGASLGRDVVMISITVDPKTDTSTVLDRYAREHGARPGWYFLTGSLNDIDKVRRHLGVNRDGGDKTEHTGMLAYGNDATGQWAATPAMAEPAQIARSVLRLVRRAAP
jgi:protein SCO1